MLADRVRDERKKREVAGALDRVCQLTLVARTRSRDPFWYDLSLFGEKTPEPLLIFVIDVRFFRVAEPARAFLARYLALLFSS